MRVVTAAQTASEANGSYLPSPPPCTQRLDGAGWSVNAIADQPHSSAARANELTASGRRMAGDQPGSPTPCCTANFTAAPPLPDVAHSYRLSTASRCSATDAEPP